MKSLELKNTILKFENSIEGLKNKLEMTKGRVSKLEDQQNLTNKETRLEKIK